MKYGKIIIAIVLIIGLTVPWVIQFGCTVYNTPQTPADLPKTPSSSIEVANFIIAAYDSSSDDKQQADYICDGVDDQVEINAAINTLPSGGGKVLLLAGIYIISDSILPLSNSCLVGIGTETVIKLKDNLPDPEPDIYGYKDWGMIESLGVEKSNIHIANLTLDGNRDNQTVDLLHGVYYGGVSSWSLTSVVFKNIKDTAVKPYVDNPYGVILANTFINNGSAAYIDNRSNHTVFVGNTLKRNNMGVLVDNCEGVVISGNTFDFTGVSMIGSAITFARGSIRGIVTNNSLVGGVGLPGILLYGSGVNQDAKYHWVTNNTIKGFAKGIVIRTEADSEASYNTIIGNTIIENYEEGVYLSGNAHHNLISGNFFLANSQAANGSFDHILLAGNSDYNTIVGNNFQAGSQTNKPRCGVNISSPTCGSNVVRANDLQNAGTFGSLKDEGTGTIIE